MYCVTRIRTFKMFALILIIGTRIAPAAETLVLIEGQLEGVNYVISMPPAWNGGLVMFAHGYEGEGTGTGVARLSPLAPRLSPG